MQRIVFVPMGDVDARFRQQLREHFLDVTDGVDFIVQKINLSAALQFAQRGFADLRFRKARYKSLDREAPLRRSGDHRKIA